MDKFRLLPGTIRLLGNHRPGRLALIFGLTILLGVNSGFSIVLLIPMLQLLSIGNDTVPEGPALFFRNLSQDTGIPLNIETVLLVYVILLTMTALLQYWKNILDAGYQQTFIYELRRRLFRKIIHADWTDLHNKSKTNHLQVLAKEVPNMAEFLYFVLQFLTTAIVAAAYTFYAMLISVKFTLLIMFVGLVLFAGLRKYMRRSVKLGEGYVSSYNRLLKYVDDFWETVKIAKVHHSEDFYYHKFDQASNSILDLEFRIQKNWSSPQLIYRIAGIFVLVIVVYLGYSLNKDSLSSFFILVLIFARIFPQLTTLNTDINMVLTNVASMRLVMQVDEGFPDKQREETSVLEPLLLKEGIRFERVEFCYPDNDPLFSSFSEFIPSGKITGILGESGIGKTTLIDLIAGLQKPVSGQILVDGQVLDNTNLDGWKKGIGYLPQDSFFIDGSLRENLVWDSREDVSNDDILEVLRQVNASHLVNRFPGGLEQEVVNYPLNFSGGERQRLALARVLLRKPRLLLLDEATSSLDTENEQNIMEVLASLKKKVTIVFVTHRSSLCPWFDKVIRL